jgi:Na+/phosphate symporter
MRALLATNQEKKAEIELKIAEWYSRKAEKAAKNGNIEAASKNLDKYNKMMEKIQARVQKMDGAKDEAGIKKSAEKLVGLERAIEVHQQRIDEFKQKLASENLTLEQKARLEEKLAKMESNTQKLTDLQAKKKEDLNTKLMAISGKTKAEADNEMKKIREKAREAGKTKN